ncbi:MAG: hypothetical protein KGH68_03805, partial [Patescibacteria group bacterium]|nr:hypothetical protein [Patescibacteria group bacterium]
IALIVIAYAAFIDATITNIVSAKSMQTEISSLTTTMSDLESHYLSARSAISLDVALAQGYAQDDNPTFIMRTSANSLSFNQ